MSEITGKGDRKINQEQAIRNFMRQYLNKPKDGQMLHSMLEDLGEHYEADRAYIFELNEDDTWERYSEHHVERIYEPEALTAMLQEAGFTEIEQRGELSDNPPAEDEARIFFVARKPV